jgi:hypothetical protein
MLAIRVDAAAGGLFDSKGGGRIADSGCTCSMILADHDCELGRKNSPKARNNHD